ncbi:Protocadherin Fat 2 [Fukomys damarensis]|uniref:Protocadherin Fat 2 n=1 Tax=Fukomys damarensis TaxID=885580 RepID=A0A091E4P5_FUKDA|nr:Protocadherin Fat 2 [Fukomys damarensis]
MVKGVRLYHSGNLRESPAVPRGPVVQGRSGSAGKAGEFPPTPSTLQKLEAHSPRSQTEAANPAVIELGPRDCVLRGTRHTHTHTHGPPVSPTTPNLEQFRPPPQRDRLLSRAYDKDVAGKADAYRFLNKTKDFVIDAAVLEIDEDYPLFQSIYRVMTTDEDLAHGDRLTYTIETQLSGPKIGANSFGVDAVNGVVSLKGEDTLDFDKGYHVFQLTLRATDTTGLFCQGTIIIKIRNINDERPQFEPFPLDSINVTEKKAVGEIVARVKAIDPDEDTSITYAFKTQQEMFGLDPSTGIITLLQPLHLDNRKAYSLDMEARDSGNNTGAYTLTVWVGREEEAIACDPNFETGIVHSSFTDKI